MKKKKIRNVSNQTEDVSILQVNIVKKKNPKKTSLKKQPTSNSKKKQQKRKSNLKKAYSSHFLRHTTTTHDRRKKKTRVKKSATMNFRSVAKKKNFNFSKTISFLPRKRKKGVSPKINTHIGFIRNYNAKYNSHMKINLQRLLDRTKVKINKKNLDLSSNFSITKNLEQISRKIKLGFELFNKIDVKGSLIVCRELSKIFKKIEKNRSVFKSIVDNCSMSCNYFKYKGKLFNLFALIYSHRSCVNYDKSFKFFKKSLKVYRKLSMKDEEFLILKTLGEEYLGQDKFSFSNLYFEQSIKVCYNQKEEKANILEKIGENYFSLDEYNDALISFKDSLMIFEELGLKENVASILNSIGEVLFQKKEYKKSLKFYEDSMNIFVELELKEGQGLTYRDVGNVYLDMDEFEKALESYFRSLEIFSELKDNNGKGNTIDCIGQAYFSMGEHSKSLEYFQKSLKLASEQGEKEGKGIILNNIALIYFEKGEFVKTLETYQKSYQIAREINNKYAEGIILNNIALVYEEKENYEKAFECLGKSLTIFQPIGLKKEESLGLNNLSAVLCSKKEYSKSLDFGKRSLNISKEIGFKQGQAIALKNLSGTYFELKDYEKSKNLLNLSTNLYKEMKLEDDVERNLNFLSLIETQIDRDVYEELKMFIKSKKANDFEIVKEIENIKENKFFLSLFEDDDKIYEIMIKDFPIYRIALKIVNFSIKKSKIERESYKFPESVNHPNILSYIYHFREEIDSDLFPTIRTSKNIKKQETGFWIYPLTKCTLKQRIKEGKISEMDFLNYTNQILQGICYLHKNGLVHRSLGEDSVMFNFHETLLLSHFEYHLDCKKYEIKEFKTELKEGFRVGNEYFLPPEILNKKKGEILDYSKTDIYATGIICCKMLMHNPFDEEDPRKRNKIIPLPKRVSFRVREIIEKMIEFDFNKRINCYDAQKIVNSLLKKKMKENFLKRF